MEATKQTMMSSSSSSSSEQEPEELLDPITLTLLEEAVVGPCGHSFSKITITRWLKTAPRAACPVCKSALAVHQLAPNWGLRNAVERYETKHGKRKAKNENENENDEKPSAPILDHLPDDDDHDDTAKPTATADGAVAQQQQQTAEEEDWSFLCIDVPGSNHSCCAWACTDCGLCHTARGCGGDNAIAFPLTTLLCCLSFGRCSSWYSRSLCGLVFPVFVGLLLLFMLVDLVYILIAFTVLGLFLLLAMLVVAPCYFLCLKQTTTTEDTTTPEPPAPES